MLTQKLTLASALAVALLASERPACADIAILIEEAIGGAGEFIGSGHSAVYLSNICAETPVKVRLCRPGEEGVVVGTYPEWGTKIPVKWLAVPKTAFIYGVERADEVPLYTNGKVRSLVRNTYRARHFESIVPSLPDGSKPPGRWEQMLDSAFNRDIYAYHAVTTRAQDEKVVEELNAMQGVQDFATTWNNCADFTKRVVNLYFSNSTYRDVANDLTMTTPKAIAKTFHEYVSSRPEMQFHVTKIPQVSGPIRRSMDIRHFSEKALISKKYFLSMAFTNPPLYGAFMIPFVVNGIYGVHTAYSRNLGPESAALALEESRIRAGQEPVAHIASLKSLAPTTSNEKRLSQIRNERKRLALESFGSKKQWDEYKARFAPMVARSLEIGWFKNRTEVKAFFKDLELQSKPGYDGAGHLMLEVDDHGVARKLGITPSNLTAPWSDPVLAYKLMIAKIDYQVNATFKNRDSIRDFEGEWELLTRLAERAEAERKLNGERNYSKPFRQNVEVVSGKKKAQRFLMVITH